MAFPRRCWACWRLTSRFTALLWLNRFTATTGLFSSLLENRKPLSSQFPLNTYLLFLLAALELLSEALTLLSHYNFVSWVEFLVHHRPLCQRSLSERKLLNSQFVTFLRFPTPGINDSAKHSSFVDAYRSHGRRFAGIFYPSIVSTFGCGSTNRHSHKYEEDSPQNLLTRDEILISRLCSLSRSSCIWWQPSTIANRSALRQLQLYATEKLIDYSEYALWPVRDCRRFHRFWYLMDWVENVYEDEMRWDFNEMISFRRTRFVHRCFIWTNSKAPKKLVQILSKLFLHLTKMMKTSMKRAWVHQK